MTCRRWCCCNHPPVPVGRLVWTGWGRQRPCLVSEMHRGNRRECHPQGSSSVHTLSWTVAMRVWVSPRWVATILVSFSPSWSIRVGNARNAPWQLLLQSFAERNSVSLTRSCWRQPKMGQSPWVRQSSSPSHSRRKSTFPNERPCAVASGSTREVQICCS